MASVNVLPKIYTHEGGLAKHINAEQALRRSVMSCFLWEKEFYEDGEEIAARIGKLVDEVDFLVIADLAIEAREKGNLRHVPLLLLSLMCRRWSRNGWTVQDYDQKVSDTIARVVQRADELTELLAIHAKVNGTTPDKIKKTLSAQMKKGLAKALTKFDEYQLAKYDRAGAVRLRDVLFLTHANPLNKEQSDLWKRLVNNELENPDTWEVSLSAGKDKCETFTRLLTESRLGYLALLRNLRNMVNAGVDTNLISGAILARKGAQRVLPFRYVAAARAVPQLEPVIDVALQKAIAELPELLGKTVVLVDVSGSMSDKLSAKSDLTRKEAAAALASIIKGNLRVFTFADNVIEVPPRRGMAGIDAISRIPGGGTRLFEAISRVNSMVDYDRLIVITDEQAFPSLGQSNYYLGRVHYAGSGCPDPKGIGYMINVASAKNGVGYGKWVHIDGFSESVLRFISAHESQQ